MNSFTNWPTGSPMQEVKSETSPQASRVPIPSAQFLSAIVDANKGTI
jgi:hypothetical protein